jgi:hypothetical protein
MKLSLNKMKKFWCERCETVFLHPVQIILSERQVDLVAQLVEHITFNDGALGSSPSGITKDSVKKQGLFYVCYYPHSQNGLLKKFKVGLLKISGLCRRFSKIKLLWSPAVQMA